MGGQHSHPQALAGHGGRQTQSRRPTAHHQHINRDVAWLHGAGTVAHILHHRPCSPGRANGWHR